MVPLATGAASTCIASPHEDAFAMKHLDLCPNCKNDIIKTGGLFGCICNCYSHIWERLSDDKKRECLEEIEAFQAILHRA